MRSAFLFSIEKTALVRQQNISTMKLVSAFLGICLCLFLNYLPVSAQQQANALIVSEPSDLAGAYRAIQPAPLWGVELLEDLTAPATFASDPSGSTYGCNDGLSDLTDKIVLVDRGNCSFLDKVMNAQSKNAVAVVICNNTGVHAIPNLNESDDEAMITIPVFSMSQHDCNVLRVALTEREYEMTLGYSCMNDTEPSALWGNQQGEGDFAAGLNGWSVISDADTSWYWTMNESIPGVIGSSGRISEGSSCNGYMVLPSAHFDDLDLCPLDPLEVNFCSGSLISPEIDMSGATVENLVCKFYHQWNYYHTGNTSLITSYDGGATWPDTMNITTGPKLNPEVVVPDNECVLLTSNTDEEGENFFYIPIPGYNNQGSIVLQFRHNGAYYYATIDDVMLLDQEFTDIEIIPESISRSPAVAMPCFAKTEIPLHADIINNSNLSIPNATIEVETTNPEGVKWTTINSSFQEQPSTCFLDENSSFRELFIPREIGTYKVNYRNITENDQVRANDTTSFSFEVTDGLWRSVDKPSPDQNNQHREIFTGVTNEAPGKTSFCGYDWALAYNFYLAKGDYAFFRDLRFGINFNLDNSGEIKVYLYEWNPTAASLDPDNNPMTQDWQVASEDLVLVGVMGDNGFNSLENSRPMHPLLTDQSDLVVRMAAANLEDGEPLVEGGELVPLELKGNQQYSLVFVMNTDTPHALEFIANDANYGAPYDLTFTNRALHNLGRPERYGSRVACNLTDDGAFNTELPNLSYSRSVANEPWIEMVLIGDGETISGIEPVDETKNSLEVFPNPSSDVITIDIVLAEATDELSIKLVNINGQLARQMVLNDVVRERFHMTVSDLSAGVYTLSAESAAGLITKKVVITR